MTSRRSLLKMIGLAPAAAIASKAEQLTSAGIAADMPAIPGMNYMNDKVKSVGQAIGRSYIDDNPAYEAWKLATGKVFPDYKLENIARQNRVVTYLDPDLASNKSYSLDFKIRKQRERNIQEAIAKEQQSLSWRRKQREFYETFGFEIY